MPSHAGVMLPSHTGDDAARVTWLWRDVDAESGWRRRCWGDMATVRCRCQVKLAMALQLKVEMTVVRMRSPRDRSIDLLSHCEEVGYSCWLVAE
jgi:hypothetical protein